MDEPWFVRANAPTCNCVANAAAGTSCPENDKESLVMKYVFKLLLATTIISAPLLDISPVQADDAGYYRQGPRQGRWSSRSGQYEQRRSRYGHRNNDFDRYRGRGDRYNRFGRQDRGYGEQYADDSQFQGQGQSQYDDSQFGGKGDIVDKYDDSQLGGKGDVVDKYDDSQYDDGQYGEDSQYGGKK